MKYAVVPGEEQWRISLVQELITAKFEDNIEMPLNEEELEEILTYVCTS